MIENPISKPRLVFLSDIWGVAKSKWIEYYVLSLSPYYDLHYYDVCELAKIDTTICLVEGLHQQFINGGIERVVNQILELERDSVIILGFSIGGLIGWQAALQNLNISSLIAVSSTRLRYESQKPSAEINLYYGALDLYVPNPSWFEKFEIEPHIYSSESHEMYQKPEVAKDICNRIIRFSTNDF